MKQFLFAAFVLLLLNSPGALASNWWGLPDPEVGKPIQSSGSFCFIRVNNAFNWQLIVIQNRRMTFISPNSEPKEIKELVKTLVAESQCSYEGVAQ